MENDFLKPTHPTKVLKIPYFFFEGFPKLVIKILDIYWFHYEMFGKIMSCKFEYLYVVWISCFGDICKVSDNNFLPPALSVTNYILFWWEEVYFSLNQWRFRVITTWPITGIKVGSFRCLWFQSSFPSLQWK